MKPRGQARAAQDISRVSLIRALSGTALRTVKRTLSQDVIHSEEGVDEIVKLLAKFNPTTAAHWIFSAYKGHLQTKRATKETSKLFVNRFEAAASELRDLTGPGERR